MPNNPQPSADNHARTYLVTGVAGFIASKVAEQLLAAGHTVVGVDNLNDYYDVRLKLYRLARLAELAGCAADKVASLKDQVTRPAPQVSGLKSQVYLKSNRVEFRVLDIENLPALEEVFQAHKFDAVFNLAARAGVRYSLEFPELYRRTNVLGEENVLKCQVKYGVKKHVLASSSSVYAGCPMPFAEDAVLGQMQSPYAETKRQAERLAREYHEKHGLDVSVLRYFTVFGPAGRPDMSPLRFIKWIDEGTPITLYGDGTQSRDFTYVDDIARGTILAGQLFGGQMTEDGGQTATDNGQPTTDNGQPTTDNGQPTTANRQPAPAFEIINLGGGRNPISLQTMIAFIEKALAESSQRSAVSSQRSTGNRQPATGSVRAIIRSAAPSPADMRETWADISKAKRLLGWSPEIAPVDGFQLTVDWHVQNRKWLRGIKL